MECTLAELHAISENYDDVQTHVVFVHGLSGHIELTWTTKTSNSTVLWPKWLDEDISGIGVWLVGYPAAKTNWSGHGMPLSDRADNILARLLAEPRLGKGHIIFVVHSLGGLVVEQLLRNANRDSGGNKKAESFLSRVRRIAFLGTPHRGALLANIGKALSFLVRPSAATRDLLLGSPQLKDLNFWYRRYSQDNGIENLVLAEGRPESFYCFTLPEAIGKIVSSSSADAGLPELTITVDESHTSICKPASRDNDIYVYLRDFISRPFGPSSKVTQTVEAIEKNTAQLEKLAIQSQAQNKAITDLTQVFATTVSASAVDTTFIDMEMKRQLERLRKCRLFAIFNTIEETRQFVASLRNGALALASSKAKADAFAWCARILSIPTPNEAQSILDTATSATIELTAIARGFIALDRSGLGEALGEIVTVNTPMSRGAAYICVLRAKGFEEAKCWLQQVALTINDLDSDAKFFYIQGALENGAWASALEAATVLTAEDFESSPALIMAAAHAYVTQAIPDELRMLLLRYLPIDATNLPLRSEPEYLAYRRIAADLYERMELVARAFGLSAVAGEAGDRCLWLRLMDPESKTRAQQELATSIKDPSMLLRRLSLALQFGVEIDLLQVEKEVDRQTALSGGTSSDAAVARFALAFVQKGRRAAAAYVDRHRKQLLDHLDWKGVYFFEIEMLATSGQSAQAEVRLREAIDRGLTPNEADRLRRLLVEAAGSDPIAGRLAIYEQSRSIIDLRHLVDAYEESGNWAKTAEYGKILLDQTGDILDARRYAVAMYNKGQLDDVLKVFSAYPTLAIEYYKLSLLYAQTLFEMGNLNEARLRLNALRQASDSAEARQLQVDIAIASGDWESLQAFVESEWGTRTERVAIELLRAGQIAQMIGVARGKDLVREAAKQAAGDPGILIGCYHAAAAAGWEDSAEAYQWLVQGAVLSEQAGDGAIQRVSIEDLIERKPAWDKHETDTWKLLNAGDIPIFTAGRLLNRSILSLFLLPALRSMNDLDVRKRPVVHAFSGARQSQVVDPHIVALDPTTLITTEFIGVLDLCIATFERVVIPHSTLGWLLEEKAKILFHQPSRVTAARELRRMIVERHLHAFDGDSTAPESLVNEVGEELAALIAEAARTNHTDMRQRFVVRGGPIYKVSTFMKEEADLAAYEPFLCSSFDVVEKLAQKGVLTTQEAKEARTKLEVREKPWSCSREIADGAILYLDDITVSHFEFTNLLDKIHRANITAIIPRGEIEEANALIAYDAMGANIVALVDRMRSCLRTGLEQGKIRLGKAIRINDAEGPLDMMAHPSAAMLKLMDEADAGVSDDRFINQHMLFGSETVTKPLLTTLDILDILERRGVLSTKSKLEARTMLRRANFALMPLDYAELSELVSEAPVINGVLIETAELRAVRESILRVRMSEILQFPKELTWLNGLFNTVLRTLQEQWKGCLDAATAIARSDWLLALADVKGWTHRLDEDTRQLTERYQNWVWLLMMLPIEQPQPVKEAYWRWFDSRILTTISEEDPETYAFLINRAKMLVSQIAEYSAKDMGITDE